MGDFFQVPEWRRLKNIVAGLAIRCYVAGLAMFYFAGVAIFFCRIGDILCRIGEMYMDKTVPYLAYYFNPFQLEVIDR